MLSNRICMARGQLAEELPNNLARRGEGAMRNRFIPIEQFGCALTQATAGGPV